MAVIGSPTLGWVVDSAIVPGSSTLVTVTVIATVAVFALIQHYNDFMNPLIYINSMDKWPLALGIRAYNDSYAKNWEVVFAASTVMLTPMVAIFIIAQRYFVQGIAMTGFGGR